MDPTDAALTHALDHIEIIKSHRIPADASPMIYLVRDGRNATLSFLYMTFLFGGHQYSELREVYEGIWRLDATEGCWADHVAEAVQQSEARKVLFVRHEDLVLSPETALKTNDPIHERGRACRGAPRVRPPEQGRGQIAQNPYNGYLYEPAKGSIYDILEQRRGGDYWRHISMAEADGIFTTAARPRFYCISATSVLPIGGRNRVMPEMRLASRGRPEGSYVKLCRGGWRRPWPS